MKYYATYKEGNTYPIILVTFDKGNFKDRIERKTGEIFKTSKEALIRTEKLNTI